MSEPRFENAMLGDFLLVLIQIRDALREIVLILKEKESNSTKDGEGNKEG
jgi:hypothetical protein